jgi:chromate transport protein ChrA
MDISEQIKPIRKYNSLAIASSVLGLMSTVFPIISIVYLITANGGAGYLQSLFCGIPIAVESILTGIVSLMQIRKTSQKGSWMAILGIVVGVLFFPAFCILVYILIAPYLFGGAQ